MMMAALVPATVRSAAEDTTLRFTSVPDIFNWTV